MQPLGPTIFDVLNGKFHKKKRGESKISIRREEKENRRVENRWRRPFNGYTFSLVAIPASNYHKNIANYKDD
jgi:hypothetical protein